MDDEEQVRNTIEAMLSHYGNDVILANDGEEAIEMYKKAMEANEPFDLVIMDLTIPGGMGGKEAVKKIHEINSVAKVIVSSGYSNDPIIASYTEYGFCGAVVKPFGVNELVDAVRQALL